MDLDVRGKFFFKLFNVNVLLLAILVPGGPIENRDFSNMKGASFWGFNFFLIILGLASFMASYLILTNIFRGIYLGILLSGLYFIVYIVDLSGVFPKSPTLMSKRLMLIEIINASLVLYTLITFVAVLHVGL